MTTFILTLVALVAGVLLGGAIVLAGLSFAIGKGLNW